jgi:exodeoxyribonuclease III
MVKIISWNVNGIRACIRKGFWDWFDEQDADIVCLQETKITQHDFHKLAGEHGLIPLVPNDENEELPINNSDRKIYYALATAKKAGYSGVAIFCKRKPNSIKIGLGKSEYDDEGRTLIADFGKFTLVNTYVPNGGRDLDRVPYKIKYSDYLLRKLQALRKEQKNVVICGDMNVAHTEIDIKNAKSNANNSGFTQIERDWFTKLLSKKYSDTFRVMNPDARDHYTWWSYRPGVRAKNIGWRIDYFVVTDEMMPIIKKSSIQMEQVGSDHCPIELIVR